MHRTCTQALLIAIALILTAIPAVAAEHVYVDYDHDVDFSTFETFMYAPAKKGMLAQDPRLSLATRALATDFRPPHLSEYPDTRTAGVSLHTHPPGGRHSVTALPGLLEFCYPRQDSIGLHRPIPVGKFRADRGRTRMNFPILEFSYPLSFIGSAA